MTPFQPPPVHAKETCLAILACVFLIGAMNVLIAGFETMSR